MATKAKRISEELVMLVHVLREDEVLRAKFTEFAKLPPAARSTALTQLVGCMKAGREDAQLIRAVSSLKDAKLFDAVANTLRELDSERVR